MWRSKATHDTAHTILPASAPQQLVTDSDPGEPVSEPTPTDGGTPQSHANRLLYWLQVECNSDSPTFGQAYVLTFDEVTDAYAHMCAWLGWTPIGWIAVARHFTPLTGGKQYRKAFNPKSGRHDANVRSYTIPSPNRLPLTAPVRANRLPARETGVEPTPELMAA